MTLHQAKDMDLGRGDWVSYWDNGWRTGRILKVYLGRKKTTQWVRIAALKYKGQIVRHPKRIPLADVQERLGKRRKPRKRTWNTQIKSCSTETSL